MLIELNWVRIKIARPNENEIDPLLLDPLLAVRLQYIQSIIISIAHSHGFAEYVHVEELGEYALCVVVDRLVVPDADHVFDTSVLAEDSPKLLGVTGSDEDQLDALVSLLINFPVCDGCLQV